MASDERADAPERVPDDRLDELMKGIGRGFTSDEARDLERVVAGYRELRDLPPGELLNRTAKAADQFERAMRAQPTAAAMAKLREALGLYEQVTCVAEYTTATVEIVAAAREMVNATATPPAEAQPVTSGERELWQEALEFYADPGTWVAAALVPDRPCGEIIDDFSAVETEWGVENRPGAKARAALGVRESAHEPVAARTVEPQAAGFPTEEQIRRTAEKLKDTRWANEIGEGDRGPFTPRYHEQPMARVEARTGEPPVDPEVEAQLMRIEYQRAEAERLRGTVTYMTVPPESVLELCELAQAQALARAVKAST